MVPKMLKIYFWKRMKKTLLCEFVLKIANSNDEFKCIFFEIRPVEIDGVNDIAAIVCSSGTTGLSKGTKIQLNVMSSEFKERKLLLY